MVSWRLRAGMRTIELDHRITFKLSDMKIFHDFMHLRAKTICEFQISHEFIGISEHGKNGGGPPAGAHPVWRPDN